MWTMRILGLFLKSDDAYFGAWIVCKMKQIEADNDICIHKQV